MTSDQRRVVNQDLFTKSEGDGFEPRPCPMPSKASGYMPEPDLQTTIRARVSFSAVACGGYEMLKTAASIWLLKRARLTIAHSQGTLLISKTNNVPLMPM